MEKEAMEKEAMVHTSFERDLHLAGYGDEVTQIAIESFWRGILAAATLIKEYPTVLEAMQNTALEMLPLTRKIREHYEQLGKKFQEAERSSRPEGERRVDDRNDPPLGESSEGQDSPAREDRSDRGGEEDRAKEGTLDADRSPLSVRIEKMQGLYDFRAISPSFSKAEGSISTTKLYIACLREIASYLENETERAGLAAIPDMLIGGLPFYPTSDGTHVEVYALHSQKDYRVAEEHLRSIFYGRVG